jgi:hypothetical protein
MRFFQESVSWSYDTSSNCICDGQYSLFNAKVAQGNMFDSTIVSAMDLV